VYASINSTDFVHIIQHTEVWPGLSSWYSDQHIASFLLTIISLPSNVEDKNDGATFQLPLCHRGLLLNYVSTKTILSSHLYCIELLLTLCNMTALKNLVLAFLFKNFPAFFRIRKCWYKIGGHWWFPEPT
jgi:hypothetical protein